MDAPSGRGEKGDRQRLGIYLSKESRVARLAGPVATLVLTLGLELFDAPVLSALAALRIVEALRDDGPPAAGR